MSFIKRDIKDRVVQNPKRYKLKDINTGAVVATYDLEPDTGIVTEKGTAINKAYLQPIEDALNDLNTDKLDKTGEGKDITVTFTEAAAEADIKSGEKLSIIFGKILKKLKNVAPTSHAKNDGTYGLGNANNFGHVKVRNDLSGTATEGEAVSPAQIKIINDKIYKEKPVLLATVQVPSVLDGVGINISSYLKNNGNPYDEYIFELTGNLSVTNGNGKGTAYVDVGLSESPTANYSMAMSFLKFYIAENSTAIVNNLRKIISPNNTYFLVDTVRNIKIDYHTTVYGNKENYLINVLNDSAYLRICRTMNYGVVSISNNTLILKVYGVRYKNPII